MKELENKALFELVRTAPTELSQEQVMQMISTLPALPPPGNTWFKNINLNSIIMTTTTIAIITSAVIYFSSPKADPQLQGQELSGPATTEQATTGPVTSIQDSLEQIKKLPAPETHSPTPPAGTVEKMKQVAAEVSTPHVKQTATPIAEAPKPAATDRNTVEAAVPDTPLPTTASTTSTAPTAVDRNTSETTPPVTTTKTPRLNELKLKRLKRTLQRELVSDYLIQTKHSFMVLQFKEGEIFVNDQRLDYAEFTKYSELLYKFRVDPGPEKRVVIDTKFIMVGDFTDQGFKGASQGKAMNIKFYDNGGMEMRDLFSDNDGKEFSRSIIREPNSTAERGDLYLKTEGRVKDAEVNVSLLNRMSADTGGGLLSDDYKQVQNFKNATTIFEKGNEENTIEFSTKQVKSFKKELYKNLVADKLVANKSEPVVMLIGASPFKVNNNNALEGEIYSRYQRILQKYNLSPDTYRRVIMDKDFIMIGDFEDGIFIGTVQGTLNSEAVKGTVIEKALEGYGVFGTSYHLSSKEGLEIGTKLKTSAMKSLKKDLYKKLLADGQIDSKTADVVMEIHTNSFKVNDNRNMLPDMTREYTTLLAKYKVKPQLRRKILMSADFMLVGDFSPTEVNGSLLGMLQEEKLLGSMFEKELKGRDINLGDMTYRIGGPENNNDEPQQEERTIASFERLEVSGLAVVYFTQGPLTKARVEVSGMHIEDVITQSEGGTLKVSTRENNVNGEQIAVYVSSPNLTTIEVKDAAEVIGSNQVKADILKVMSRGSGAIVLDVNTYRLHLEMDGGDVDIKGQAQMEKVDFLRKSDAGTLVQSRLNVLENWTYEGDATWKAKGLSPLSEALMAQLTEDKIITNKFEHVSINFFSDELEINEQPVKGIQLETYVKLLSTYGIELKNNRRLWLTQSYLILADKAGDIFELQVMGTDLEFNIEGSWEDLEEAVLGK